MTPPAPDLFIILSGGAGSRLGGRDKAGIVVGGDRLLDRALAVTAGRPVILVGPALPVQRTVVITREDPPGGGPAAGIAAAVAVLRQRPPLAAARVAVLAVDQPGVTAGTWRRLADAMRQDDGAILVRDGRRQYGVVLVRFAALQAAVARRPTWHGHSLRSLLDDIIGVEVPAAETEARDIDTVEDLGWWSRQVADGHEAPRAPDRRGGGDHER